MGINEIRVKSMIGFKLLNKQHNPIYVIANVISRIYW